MIFKIHLYQIIWLSAILAFRFGLSDLHSSGLLHVTGSLANARLRPTKNLAPFHNFYKIVPLRSVPHNQAKPTTNPLPQAVKKRKPCGALDEEATQLPSIKRSS